MDKAQARRIARQLAVSGVPAKVYDDYVGHQRRKIFPMSCVYIASSVDVVQICDALRSATKELLGIGAVFY